MDLGERRGTDCVVGHVLEGFDGRRHAASSLLFLGNLVCLWRDYLAPMQDSDRRVMQCVLT